MAAYDYRNKMKLYQVRLVGKDGQPLKNERVVWSQKSHQFLFGCGAFDSLPLCSGELSGKALEDMNWRFDKWLSLFNAGTLPFYWGRYEPIKGEMKRTEMMNAAHWLKEKGVRPKGHPLCWHTACADWLLNHSVEKILDLQLERIHRDVADYKGIVDMWDVINEVVIMPIFDKYDNGITRVCKKYGRVKTIKMMFEAAKEANPDAVFLLNDFNTSISYEILIDGCLEAGVPIDVIGIQSHQHQGYWGDEKLEEVLERFSHFGLPIHFTENTLVSGDLMPADIVDLNDFQVSEWKSTPEGEERQAREMEKMYRRLFAHPLVEGITAWNFGDGGWLGAPAGIIRENNTVKPSYQMLHDLIKKEWWSKGETMTDEHGIVHFVGYAGEYDLSLAQSEKQIGSIEWEA